MDEQVNPLERDYELSVVLPGGLERNATVHGSKPVMDLLVTLCASYHLNPSDYTVEVLSPNKNVISCKANSPIGSLEAEKIVLKPKGSEEKIRRPYMPEASVRLLINYNKTHKTVVRVNPRVPLEELLPVVCNKCEFQVETTVLLRDGESQETLDLSQTLNQLGLREVFARDSAARERQQTPEAAAEVISPPPLLELPKKERKQKDSSGILSLFRRRKKKSEMRGAGSAPASPSLSKQTGVGVSLRTDVSKKRRAPQPPMGASQSVPNNLTTCHVGGSQRSAESTLRRTKRRAPPPPGANTPQELQENTEVKDSLNAIEEQESDDSGSVKLSPSSSSSPHPCSSSSRPPFTHFHHVAEPYLPSFRGRDFSDARTALAKVLTSSVSKGTLMQRLRNSATFPKFHSGSSFTPGTPRSPDNTGLRAELESVVTSHVRSEQDWEDPGQRKGMTTFKVVPQKTHNPELNPDKIIKTPESPDPEPDQITKTPESPDPEPDQITKTPESPDPELDQITKTPESPDPEPDQITKTSESPDPEPDQITKTSESPDPEPDQITKTPESPDPEPDQIDKTTESPDPEPDQIDKTPESPDPEPDQIEKTPESPDPEPDQIEKTPESPDPEPDQMDETPESPAPESDQITKTPESPDPELNPDQITKTPGSQEPESDQMNKTPESSDPEPDQNTRTPESSDPEPDQITRTPESPDPEPDQLTECTPEVALNSAEPEEDPGSPDGSEVEAPDCDGPLSPPPLPDLDQQDKPDSPLSEVKASVETQTEDPEVTCEVRATPSPCSDGEASSECQSLSGQSDGTDVEHCGSYVVEEEAASDEDDDFPPPPPPVYFDDSMEEGREDEDKEQSAAKPRSSATSRFAQAVASAVQRSRLLSGGKGSGPKAPSGPQSRLPSPPRSSYQYGA